MMDPIAILDGLLMAVLFGGGGCLLYTTIDVIRCCVRREHTNLQLIQVNPFDV